MAVTEQSSVRAEVDRQGFAVIDCNVKAGARSSQIGGDPRREAGCAEARALLRIGGSRPDKQARDPLADVVPDVLEVFPDMDNAYTLDKLRQLFLEQYCPLKELGKRKATNDAPESSPTAKPVTVLQLPRNNFYQTKGQTAPSRSYCTAAALLLRVEFPYYPPAECRRVLQDVGGFYAPARKHLLMLSREANAEVLTATSQKPTKRSKAADGSSAASGSATNLHRRSSEAVLEKLTELRAFKVGPAVLKEEVQWVYSKEGDAYLAQEIPLPSAGIECSCCCEDDIPFEHFVQCRDGHLFCKNCARSYAEERIGIRVADLQCIHLDGCEAGFAESEIRRFLPDKAYELLEKLRQELSLQRAGIEGLEECPYCPYAVVIENPDDKVFRCLNEEYERTSCRLCKTEDHIPLSCEQAKEHREGAKRHDAENMLSKTIIRKCPTKNCGVALIKQEGCNKIYCTQCRQFMCYICKQHIPANIGYAHFERRPASQATSDRCILWDEEDNRHARELARARERLGTDASPE